jgi:hypothetical protein
LYSRKLSLFHDVTLEWILTGNNFWYCLDTDMVPCSETQAPLHEYSGL